MKAAALVFALFSFTSSCLAQGFLGTRLSEDRAVLTLVRANLAESEAPKFDDQDVFAKPAVAPGGKYAGWLALYPNRGASYSLPLGVVVIDGENRDHQFGGKFGMVFGWCFDATGDAVALMYQFPHGTTPTGFDLRRIRDGKLLRRHRVDAATTDGEETLAKATPGWAQCALTSSRTQ